VAAACVSATAAVVSPPELSLPELLPPPHPNSMVETIATQSTTLINLFFINYLLTVYSFLKACQRVIGKLHINTITLLAKKSNISSV
jgi:hypothetical protein